jgi:hypothetical protein
VEEPNAESAATPESGSELEDAKAEKIGSANVLDIEGSFDKEEDVVPNKLDSQRMIFISSSV